MGTSHQLSWAMPLKQQQIKGPGGPKTVDPLTGLSGQGFSAGARSNLNRPAWQVLQAMGIKDTKDIKSPVMKLWVQKQRLAARMQHLRRGSRRRLGVN